MERDKLSRIIAEANEEREHDAKRTARDLIGEIEQQQQKIQKATDRIAELRKQLRELSVETVDENTVLGGDE